MNLKTQFSFGAFIAMLVLVSAGSKVVAQSPGLLVVDPSVAMSAQAAVQKMGVEMMKGNFHYSHERMYPRWKRRLAVRYGGMDKLEAGFKKAADGQVTMGMIVTAFRADLPTSFFTVERAKKRDPLTGKVVLDSTGREIIVEHWLTIVPTVTRVKISDPDRGGKIRTLEERSYTVAISEKGSNNWYFMTGMKPTVQDLRSMFPVLPSKKSELGLPESTAKEIE